MDRLTQITGYLLEGSWIAGCGDTHSKLAGVGSSIEEGSQAGSGLLRDVGDEFRKGIGLGPVYLSKLVLRNRTPVVEILDADRTSLEHTDTRWLSFSISARGTVNEWYALSAACRGPIVRGAAF